MTGHEPTTPWPTSGLRIWWWLCYWVSYQTYCFHTYAYSLMITWEYFLVMTKYLVKSTVRHWSTEFWLLLHVAFEPIVAQTVQCYATAIQSQISQHMHENSPCSILSFLLFDTLLFKLVGGESRKKLFWWILVSLTDHIQSIISSILLTVWKLMMETSWIYLSIFCSRFIHWSSKCLVWLACLWNKMPMFQRVGMRKGGLPISPPFQYLILMT